MSTRKKTNEGAAGTAAQNELEPMANGGAAENAENTETRKADTPEEQGNETAGKIEDAGTAGGKPDEPHTAEAAADSAGDAPKESSGISEDDSYSSGDYGRTDVPETPYAEYGELSDESADTPPMNVTRYIRLMDISGGDAAILKAKYALEAHTLREWNALYEAEKLRKVTV